MHVSEIATALAEGDTRTIEEAFRALIEFPHGARIDGARTVDALCTLLTRVSRALARDETPMPADLGAAIAAGHDPVGTDPTYAEGAGMVLKHHYHWRGIYLQHAANTGGV